MNKEEYIYLKLNKLQQQYHEEIIYLKKMLDEKPKKYDAIMKYENYNFLPVFPKRIRYKCELCGNDSFYVNGEKYVCSKCFIEHVPLYNNDSLTVSPDERIMYYGVELKVEDT